jgi:hypothetical protein
MLTCFKSLRTNSCNRHGGLELQKMGQMSVTDTIFGRWEIAVADNVYSKNENGTNIGAQTFNTYQYTFLSIQN